jgi:hypothetical protein
MGLSVLDHGTFLVVMIMVKEKGNQKIAVAVAVRLG